MLNVKLVKEVVGAAGVFVAAKGDNPAKVVVLLNTKVIQADLKAAGIKVAPVVGSNVLHVSE